MLGAQCQGSTTIPTRKQRNDLRRIGWEFFCKVCAREFEADWEPDQRIVCPYCGTAFETAWQLKANGDLVGPWLSNRAPGSG